LTQSIDRFLHRDAPTARIDLPPESVPSAVSAIAVLPLENFSGDSGQQFFVDGMHEALIAELSKIGALKVISRTSTRVYSGSTKPLREIAAELGVTKIVEGSVIRVENDVRITIRLIDARTDTNLWAESFDRDMSNILRLQQEAARAIAEKINVALTPAEESRLAGAPQVRPEAYEAYLKGMFHWYKLTPQDLQSALQCFDAALAADPDYAPHTQASPQPGRGFSRWELSGLQSPVPGSNPRSIKPSSWMPTCLRRTLPTACITPGPLGIG